LEENIVFKIVDEFIEHYYNGDYTISYFGGALGLANSLHSYVEAKSERGEHPEQFIYEKAKVCLEYITDARVNNYINESKSLLTRLKEAVAIAIRCNDEKQKLRKENQQLKDETSQLKKENERLTTLVEDLHEALSRFGPMESGSGTSGEN
jgi:predicted RNase H-like nuclease (RuvC/YqgF family)